MASLTCSEVRNLVANYGVTDGNARAVSKHINGCRACRSFTEAINQGKSVEEANEYARMTTIPVGLPLNFQLFLALPGCFKFAIGAVAIIALAIVAYGGWYLLTQVRFDFLQ